MIGSIKIQKFPKSDILNKKPIIASIFRIVTITEVNCGHNILFSE
jgi:hypothetical protein